MRRGAASLGLAFVLSNHGSQPRTIRYYRPFMQFDVRVFADGHELTVVRGDFDGPVAAAQLDLPAGATAKLETPITLQFAAQAGPPDAMVWTVVGQPRAALLRATIRIEHEAFPECTAHVDRL